MSVEKVRVAVKGPSVVVSLKISSKVVLDAVSLASNMLSILEMSGLISFATFPIPS